MLFASQIHDFLQRLPFNRDKKKKRELRALMKQKLRRLSPVDRVEKSKAIIERIKLQPAFRDAKVVMFFYPIQNEPDLRSLFEEFKDRKTIILPVVHRKEIEMRIYTDKAHMRAGHFGVPEPTGEIFVGNPDLIIVPGIAFDKDLNRLGRGGGYYDRFLKRFDKTTKFAVAYDFQLVKKVPARSHDVKVDRIITDSSELAQ